MSDTIELTDRKIYSKFIVLYDLILRLEKQGLDTKKYIQELAAIKSDYYMDALPILVHVSKATTSSTMYGTYGFIIKKNNILGRTDRLFNLICSVFDTNENASAIQNYYTTATACRSITNTQNSCASCGDTNMQIIVDKSQFLCKCGSVTSLIGAVADSEQFYCQEGKRTKHTSYIATKHCKDRLYKILAKDSNKLPVSVVKTVKEHIHRSHAYCLNNISCSTIRSILKDLKLSKYYDYVPLIRKKVAGIAPPQLTVKEIDTVLHWFVLIADAYNEERPSDKSNISNHQYWIGIIVEFMLSDSPENIMRCKGILECIHIQSQAATIENDRIRERICKKIGMIYRPSIW
jgi:hypothetical protein